MRRLEGKIQDYAWGSTDFIPELLGREPNGEPQAELWLGAHASAPSSADGQPLDELISADPEGTVGRGSVAEFGPLLPYLLKVLSAAKPLSLQAHPTRAQAEEGFAAEEEAGVKQDDPTRTYRDDWPKPEMLVALVETEILCGFRDPAESYDLFSRLGAASALELVRPLRDGGAEALEQVFGTILRLGQEAGRVLAEVAERAQQVDGEGDLGSFAQTARELAEPYPDDPGVLAALLMNRVTLQVNEATFLPAGNLHAYLRGSGVEIMANSDNVLRGGLTSKNVNVDELLKVLDFTPGFPGLVSCEQQSPGVWAYQTPAPEFALWRLEVGDDAVAVPEDDAGRVLLVTGGSTVLRAGTEELQLDRGQATFLAAGEHASVQGSGVVFVAGPGIG